jgi:myo-inositol-hexaphosphate 3-phosphohydrolase
MSPTSAVTGDHRRLNSKEQDSREVWKRKEQDGRGGPWRRSVMSQKNGVLIKSCTVLGKIYTPPQVPIYILVSSKTFRIFLLWIRNEYNKPITEFVVKFDGVSAVQTTYSVDQIFF